MTTNKNDNQNLITKNVKPFAYHSIVLRSLEKNDLSDTLTWRNHYRLMFNDSDYITYDAHEAWFNRYLTKKHDYVFIIENFKNEKVGQIALYNIDKIQKKAEIGRIVTNPQFEGFGYMKLACLAMIKLAKQAFSLEEIYLCVKKNNLRAIKLYEKCGFHFSSEQSELVYMNISLTSV